MLRAKEDLQARVGELEGLVKSTQMALGDQEKQLRAEIDRLKASAANDKTELDKLKESKKDLSLKMAKS